MAQLTPDVIAASLSHLLAATPKNKKEKKEKEKNNPLSALRCANETRCSGYVYAPAYTCDEGHALCVTCVSLHAGSCPLCRSPLPRAVAFRLEELADVLLLPCALRTKGCHFRFPREEILQHQVECKYAPKKCFGSKCKFLGDNKELETHMKKCHGERCMTEISEIKIRNINNRAVGISETQFLRSPLGIFWVKYMFSETESQLYGAVQYIGPKQEAEKLEYELEMKEYDGRKLTGLKCIYTGKMYTHFHSFENIFDSEDCFTVTLQFAQYFENNGILHLTMKVKTIE